MWPWGHLAVGYLAYSAYSHVRNDRSPSIVPVFTLAVATQLPDLIDKPLAWTLAVLPNGRSLGHSLVIAVPLLAGTWVALCRNRRQLVGPLAIGYLSHIAADTIHPVLTGELQYTGFLGWPLIPAIEYPTEQSFLAHLTAMEITPWFGAQLVLVALATGVWLADGTPGLSTVRWIATTGRNRLEAVLTR